MTRQLRLLGITPCALEPGALLLPGSNGVPTWNPELAGEAMRVKRPRQFHNTFADGAPLTRVHGRVLAEWAGGGRKTPASEPPTTDAEIPARFQRALEALRGASTLEKVEAVWKKAEDLRSELISFDRQALDQLGLTYEGRVEDFGGAS